MDHPDPGRRACGPGAFRFVVTEDRESLDVPAVLLATDDLGELLSFIGGLLP